MMPAPIVWINAFPGVGKLTVAKEIILHHDRAILISNHSLIDPVARLLGPNSRDHPRYQEERKAAREEAFRKWVSGSLFLDQMIIFTGRSTRESM